MVAKVRVSSRQSGTGFRSACPDALGQDRHALTMNRKCCKAHGVTLTLPYSERVVEAGFVCSLEVQVVRTRMKG